LAPTIAIGLSGGIDSMVSGLLLKEQYRNLFGIHFTTGYEGSPVDLSSMEKALGINIVSIDLQADFKDKVVDYFVATYLGGKTPNPCLVCNRTIKFGALFSAAAELGADLIATGHYAGTRTEKSGDTALFKGKDSLKEQSYFLAMLTRNQLGKAVFPLAEMTKQEVKQLAAKKGIAPPVKTESQDICFIRERTVADFIALKTGTPPRPGDIVTRDNTVLGRHAGLHRFTIGQRRGIDCPGPAPYYVIEIDMAANRLVVGFKEELLQRECYADHLNWICEPDPFPARVQTKIRYSHRGAASLLTRENSRVRIVFDTPQSAVTPGQAAVFYHNDQVLGAGIIQ